jgi:hypothetical protein
MKASKTSLCAYRSLYWVNQGLLQAVRSLEELSRDQAAALPVSAALNDKLRRTQALIEETRLVMNRNLAEWIEEKE